MRRRTLTIVGILVTVLVVGTFALFALDKVLSGHASDTYQNPKGARWTYGGAVVMAGFFVVCFVVAIGLRLWQQYRADKLDELIMRPGKRRNTVGKESAPSDS